MTEADLRAWLASFVEENRAQHEELKKQIIEAAKNYVSKEACAGCKKRDKWLVYTLAAAAVGSWGVNLLEVAKAYILR